MLTYSTQLKKLILPEYGRNVQRMVDHCLTIEDRAERTRCAHSVIAAMQVLFPCNTADREAYTRKLWDHLMIMSDFELDIDLPFETLRPDSVNPKPDMVFYTQGPLDFRQYGRYLIDMVYRTADMPECPEREALSILLANQMKKVMCQNFEGVEDRRIFSDMAQITSGTLRLDPEKVKLCQYHILSAPSKKKKKK